jgi:hypothetical protein
MQPMCDIDKISEASRPDNIRHCEIQRRRREKGIETVTQSEDRAKQKLALFRPRAIQVKSAPCIFCLNGPSQRNSFHLTLISTTPLLMAILARSDGHSHVAEAQGSTAHGAHSARLADTSKERDWSPSIGCWGLEGINQFSDGIIITLFLLAILLCALAPTR